MNYFILLFLLTSQLLLAQNLEKVTLQLKWTHAFQFAGYYAAKEKGYYRDAGLDVTILPAKAGVDPLESVLEKKAHYGVGSSSLLLSRSAGAKIVVLAVIFQESPYEIHTSVNIHSLHDLIGKRIMLEPQSDELLAYLHHEGITKEQLILVPHSFNTKDLIDNSVDAMSGYISNEPYYYKLAKFSYESFTPKSAGIDFYGDNLFTSEEELSENPLRVQKFREASLRGWQYAKENREEIIELIIKKYAPELTSDYLHYESDKMIPLLQPDLIEIGYMNPKRWQHIANVYKELNLLPKEFKLDGFIYDSSNRLVPKWVTNSFVFATFFVLLILLMLLYVVRTNKILRNNKDFFKTLYERSPIGLAMIDFENGAFLGVNASILNSTGYTEEEFKQFTCWDLTPKKFHKQLKKQFNILNTKTNFGPYEKECFKKDGTSYPVETMGFVMKDLNNKNIMWAFIKDLSELKESQNRLKLAASVFTYAKEGICITDTNGNIIDINDAYCSVTGYLRTELIGQNPRILQSGKHSSDFYDDMWNSLITKGFWSGEIWNKRKNNEIYAQILTISAVYDENKTLINFVALMTDITAIKNHQSELENIAHYDLLTGLPNRLSILGSLSKSIIDSKKKNLTLAVLFLDLDGFKAVNDTHGHDIGDELLKIIALRMQFTLRQNDTLARIGGDEFVGLLSDLKQIEDAIPVIERLLESVNTPVKINNFKVQVSASIGVAIYPEHGLDADILLRNSDHAMYQAKQRGKNQYFIFNG